MVYLGLNKSVVVRMSLADSFDLCLIRLNIEHCTGVASCSLLAPVHLDLLALREFHHLDVRPLLHPGGDHAHPLENHQDRVAARHHHRRLDGRQPAGPPSLPQVELLRHLLLLPPGHLPQPLDHLRSAHRPSVGTINIKSDISGAFSTTITTTWVNIITSQQTSSGLAMHDRPKTRSPLSPSSSRRFF